MSITLIAAMTHTKAIADSKKSGMLWHNKAELAHFKRETVGKKCIVGLKTAFNMPMLKDREVYVLVSGMSVGQDIRRFPNNYHFMLSDASDTITLIRSFIDSEEEVMVIGGAKTYESFMDVATKAVISTVWDDAIGDIYFPNFIGGWKRICMQAHLEEAFIVERFERVPESGVVK